MNITIAQEHHFQKIWDMYLSEVSSLQNRAQCQGLLARFRRNFNERSERFNFWVAIDDDGNVCGWQSLIPFSNNPLRCDTWAESSTYIDPPFQGRGVGEMLVRKAIDSAQHSGIKII